MNNEICLDLKNVTKAFGGLKATNDVTLDVKVGERRAMLGPNGAGKTTLFNLICGELIPTSGTITLFGQDVTKMPAHKRIALGITRTFQITNLFPELTVLDNLLLAAQGTNPSKFVMYRPISGYKEYYERAEELMAEFGIQDDRHVKIKNLSHGEQRQIEVCMALIGKPKLLLLDEPTAGLSPAETTEFTKTLQKIDPAITVCLIEHDMSVAFALAEKVSVLHQGQLVATGTVDEIKSNQTVQDIYFGTD